MTCLIRKTLFYNIVLGGPWLYKVMKKNKDSQHLGQNILSLSHLYLEIRYDVMMPLAVETRRAASDIH